MRLVAAQHCGHCAQARARQASSEQDGGTIPTSTVTSPASRPPKRKPLDTPPKCTQEFLAAGTQLWFKTCECLQTPLFWYKSNRETKTQGKKLTLVRMNTWWKRAQYFPFLTLWNKQQHYSTTLQRNKARQNLWFLSLSQTLLEHFGSHMAFFPPGASYRWKGADKILVLLKASYLGSRSQPACHKGSTEENYVPI